MSRVRYMMLACALLCAFAATGTASALQFDAACAGIVSPRGTTMAGVPVYIRATILNLGPGVTSSAHIIFTVNTTAGAFVYGPDTVTMALANPGIPVTAQSSRRWTPTQTGTYVVMVVCSNDADLNHTNDTSRITLTATPHVLSRAEVMAIADTGVIARSPHAAELAAFLYNRNAADSLLHPGEVVSSADASFRDTITSDTYLIWLDNVPQYEWYHSATFVLINAGTGALTIHEADTWPVVNNSDITRFIQEGNTSLERFRGSYPIVGSLYNATPVATSNKADWAIIIVGMNLAGDVEKTARRNDIVRATECLNTAPLGPRVDKGNVLVVAGADTLGASPQEVRTAIRSLKGKAHARIYLYYLGHGAPGSMILRAGTGTGLQNYGHDELAAELIGVGATEAHLAIGGSRSGSALDAIARKGIVKNGKMVKLKGSVVSASSSANSAARDVDGAIFSKALNDGWKLAAADLNKDGKVSLIEVTAFARSRNQNLALDDPQTAVLSDDNTTFLSPPRSVVFNSGDDGGGMLQYEVFGVDYRIVRGAPGALHDSIVSRRTLFVENASPDVHRGVNDVDVICYDAKGTKNVIGQMPQATMVPGQRIRLFDLPADCVTLEIARKKDAARIDGDAMGRVNAGQFLAAPTRVSLAHRAAAYGRGEGIYQQVAIRADSGSICSVKVDPIAGWKLSADPAAFTATPLLPGATVVRGSMPDTATQGNMIHATLINITRGDTAMQAITALLFDSVRADIGAGRYLYHALDCYGALAVMSDTLRLDNSICTRKVGGINHVDSAGLLVVSHSAFQADSGIIYRLVVLGSLLWDGASALSPENGLELQKPLSVRIDGGAVIHSHGDGVHFTGDQSNTRIEGLLVDESARNGLLFQHVSSAAVRHVRVLGSGTNAVALIDSSNVTLLDCAFDDRKIAVQGGSRLVRAWTTTLEVVALNDSGVRGATIEVRDITGDVVARDTTGVAGLSHGNQLVQYVYGGSMQQNRSPYRIRIRYKGIDTTIVHDAVAEIIRRVVLPLAEVSGVRPDGSATRDVAVGQNYPNPFGGSAGTTSIPFTLLSPCPVTLVLTDPLGREVLRRELGTCAPGEHTVTVEARDLAPGAYLYELCTPGRGGRGKMVVE